VRSKLKLGKEIPGVMVVHWYGPFWDPGTTTGSWVQTELCADETPAGPLPIGLDFGGGHCLSGRVCCCASKNIIG